MLGASSKRLLIKKHWDNISNLGIHPALDRRDIRVTRTINKIVITIISIVLISFIIQVCKHLLTTGTIIPHPFYMLVTFLPLIFVCILNHKEKYLTGRLVFILIPLLTTAIWMIAKSSQDSLIHYTYLIFPIPIVILFRSLKLQIALVILSYILFLVSHFIIVYYPAPADGYTNPIFTLILFGILLTISFVMLLFFVSEMDQSEERLQKTNEELDEFSRIASHDMKEPLRTISSYTSLIRSKHAEELSPKVSNYLGYIETRVKRLDNLLSDLTVYSAIDLHDEELQDVDLNTVLNNVKDDLRLKVKESGSKITSNHLPILKGKESHFYQLFQNLIQNSIKFQSPEGSTQPEIHIESKLQNNYHHITFQDNGIGIQEEHLENIFGKFKKLHSKDKFEGTGLGLATCKRIVEKYNGEIMISSEPGIGTKITTKFIAS